MPIRESAPLGAPCWIDLTSSNLGRAQEFYGAVFGWTFEDKGPALGGYILAAKDGHQVAGMGINVPQWPFPDGWSTYFHTADIDATVSASTAAGASLLFKPMRLPATGVMSASADPSGAVFRLWQPLEARGYELFGEPGAPAWHQLTTRDYPAAINFYSDVLSWHTEHAAERDDFRYTTATFDGQQLLSVTDDHRSFPKTHHRNGPSSSEPRTSTRRCRPSPKQVVPSYNPPRTHPLAESRPRAIRPARRSA